MSGAQTSTEMIDQPQVNIAQLATVKFPVLVPPSAPAGKPSVGLATPEQIADMINTGTIVEDEITYNGTPISVPNLPIIPPTGGYCFLQGTIVAQDQTTRDVAVWNVALAVIRTNGGVTCTPVGDTTPSVFVKSGTTAGCSVALGANSSGPSVILTGLAAYDVSWGVNLNSTTGD